MKTEIKTEQLTAIIDSREQTPFDLAPMQIERSGLHVGDYSIKGLESVVAVERKSLDDFVACCGRERDRFQRELDALRGWQCGVVVIESTWRSISMGGWRSKLTPKQVMASLAAWIAQGHTIIMGHDHSTSATITRGILFYSARYQFRQSRELIKSMSWEELSA